MHSEISRFVRWAIPGIASVIPILAAVWVTESPYPVDSLNSVGEGLATVLGGLVVSGGLGYLFACIYMAVAWNVGLAPDYRPLLADVAGSIKAIGTDGSVVAIGAIRTRREAWTVVVSFLSAHGDDSLRAALDLSDRWADFVASAGATLIGTVIGFLAFAGYACCCHGDRLHGSLMWLIIPVWLLLIGALWRSLHLAKMTLVRHTGSLFVQTLHKVVDRNIQLGWAPKTPD